MDWGSMPFFLAVARHGSLRGAAQALGATHATVDRQLRGLEQDYGVRLFDRTRGGMSLTLAGEQLLPVAEQAEEAMIDARARMMGLDQAPTGQVHVSVPPVMAHGFLPPIFAAFAKAHPEIDLRITVTNRFEDLSRLEADVSIRVAYEVTQDVIGRKVAQTAVGIYCSQRYLETEVAQAGPEGQGLSWIGWADEDEVRKWSARTPYARADIRHCAREVLLQRDMIREGMGFGYLPAILATGDPTLVRMPGTALELNRWIWILLHGELRKTARVRAFVDFMAQAIRAQRDDISGGLSL